MQQDKTRVSLRMLLFHALLSVFYESLDLVDDLQYLQKIHTPMDRSGMDVILVGSYLHHSALTEIIIHVLLPGDF